MAIYRPEDYTPAMTAKARLHLREIEETTPGPRLVDPATGELRPKVVHHLLVPSHASRPGERWPLRVSWHPHSVKVWHHGEACMGALVEGRCWHFQGGVLWVAHHWHADRLPPAGAASSPAPRPAGALAGFYD